LIELHSSKLILFFYILLGCCHPEVILGQPCIYFSSCASYIGTLVILTFPILCDARNRGYELGLIIFILNISITSPKELIKTSSNSQFIEVQCERQIRHWQKHAWRFSCCGWSHIIFSHFLSNSSTRMPRENIGVHKIRGFSVTILLLIRL